MSKTSADNCARIKTFIISSMVNRFLFDQTYILLSFAHAHYFRRVSFFPILYNFIITLNLVRQSYLFHLHAYISYQNIYHRMHIYMQYHIVNKPAGLNHLQVSIHLVYILFQMRNVFFKVNNACNLAEIAWLLENIYQVLTSLESHLPQQELTLTKPEHSRTSPVGVTWGFWANRLYSRTKHAVTLSRSTAQTPENVARTTNQTHRFHILNLQNTRNKNNFELSNRENFLFCIYVLKI